MNGGPKTLPSPRLLAVDLDGTLLDPRGIPHERDANALSALRASGVHVTIITGRLYSGTQPSAERIGVDGPVGCVDGSHIVHVGERRTLVHSGIRGATAAAVRDTFATHRPATFVFAGDAIFHDEPGLPYLRYVKTWSPQIEQTDQLHQHRAWTEEAGVTAVVALASERPMAALTSELREVTAGAVQLASFPVRRLPGMWGLVLRASGSSKGSALTWLAAHHGISTEETVCVGDWHNDVPMFRTAGRAYAMGQAPDEVKQAATHVLEETSESGGGIARVIREVFGVDD